MLAEVSINASLYFNKKPFIKLFFINCIIWKFLGNYFLKLILNHEANMKYFNKIYNPLNEVIIFVTKAFLYKQDPLHQSIIYFHQHLVFLSCISITINQIMDKWILFSSSYGFINNNTTTIIIINMIIIIITIIIILIVIWPKLNYQVNIVCNLYIFVNGHRVFQLWINK